MRACANTDCMPYLNWKHQERLKQEIAPLESMLRMTLTIPAAELAPLVSSLREIFEGPVGTELRLDLPRGWIVFWKKRSEARGSEQSFEDESRLLVAHPQDEEWVATVALSAGHGAELVSRLEGLAAGRSVSVAELGPTGKVSNLELTLVSA